MEKISVAVRFRPPTVEDAAGDRQWRIKDNRITLHKPHGTPISGVCFAFDYVFEKSSSNSSVYDLLIKSVIHAAINGFNGTAFAYGQTSSGKTFAMNGSQHDPGIIPQAVRDIFDTTQTIADREFLVRVSYMEIYNEEINDLLSLGSQKLPIHESLERGVYVSGLREEIVNSADHVLELIKLGEANRHVGETNMNVRSSRSHTIFRMVIESSAKDSTSTADAIRVSVLNLVDLAGSERIAKTGADGVRLKEGKHINKSLMILGNVINKLSENGKQRAHIPYRDSKLTRILQPALGGNAKTSIICTVAPEEVHIEETRGTLKFASRAKRITNYAQINEILTDAALLKQQKQEIDELRKKLQSILEHETLAKALEEEMKAREALECLIEKQQKTIDDLNEVLSSKATNSTQESIISSSSNEEIHSKNCMPQSFPFATPSFKSASDHFVARRSQHHISFDSSPQLENFADMADEDLWQQLNKGFRTDLNALQMTPNFDHGVDELKATSIEQINTLKEQNAILERKYKQQREEKDSLNERLTISEQEVVLLTVEKAKIEKKLICERERMRDMVEEIREFGMAIAERESLLESLYFKSESIIKTFTSHIL